MRSRKLPAGPLLCLASGLACAGLTGPPAELVNLAPGPCGTVEGMAVRKAPWVRTVTLHLDDRPVLPVSFATGDVQTFVLPAPQGPHTLTVDDHDLSWAVSVPRPDVGLDWAGWAMPPREGDPVHLDLRLVGQCPREALRLTALLTDLDRTVASSAPLAAEGDHPLDLGVLPRGRHILTLRLDAPSGRVDERQLTLEVAPPCLDDRCTDRDNDGYDAVARGGSDCDDNDPGVHPGATTFPDPDGDGAVARAALDLDCDGEVDHYDGPEDCAEGDPTIPRPEDPEPTGVDEDCDGIVDEGTVAYDDDGDGFSEERGDCNDADVAVGPKALEAPDCKDNDCDGEVDDGVERPRREDAFEPNDDRPWVLPGAQPRKGIFGGYKPTDDELPLIVRDRGDVEVFQLYAHDGSGDQFHVTARLDSAGDGLRYAVTITGRSGERTATLGAREALVLEGYGMEDDSGNYTIRVEPASETPEACPLLLRISSG